MDAKSAAEIERLHAEQQARLDELASRVAINDRTLDRFLRGIRAIEKRRKIRL